MSRKYKKKTIIKSTIHKFLPVHTPPAGWPKGGTNRGRHDVRGAYGEGRNTSGRDKWLWKQRLGGCKVSVTSRPNRPPSVPPTQSHRSSHPFVPFHSSSFRSIRLTAVTGVDERNEQTRAAVTWEANGDRSFRFLSSSLASVIPPYATWVWLKPSWTIWVNEGRERM